MPHLTPDFQTPSLKSLSSRYARKDVRQALNLSALFITPLEDGSFALADRAQTFYIIVPDVPSREELKMFHTLLNSSRMEASGAFYGEPSTTDLARDISREANRPLPRPRPSGPLDFSNLL